MSLYAQLAQEYTIDTERAARAQELYRHAALQILGHGPTHVEAMANVHHSTSMRRRPDQTLDISCSCPDWKTRGMHTQRPCKHILALALAADAQGLLAQGTPVSPLPDPLPPPPVPTLARPETFAEQVRKAVAAAVEQLSAEVEAVLRAGGTPFLVGPTGCGKTSAVRLCATRNRWGFEEVAGLFSFADGDLVGLRTAGFECAGVFARAFRRARAGETVLLFLDELLRFNVRAQDLLMRPLQEVSVPVARALGIAATQAVRLVEAPLWGIEYAPAAHVPIVLAANPWGASLDPALIRRVDPILVRMNEDVLGLFERKVADAVLASWKAVERGELPLPVEYQSLLTAQAPDDVAFLHRYLTRLEVVDKASADGYRHLLNGMNLMPAGGSHG
jgi:hypothetical protein